MDRPGRDASQTPPPGNPQNSTAGSPADQDAVVFDRQLVIDSLGGWRGMLDATLPTLAFLVAHSIGGLRVGIWAALGAALLVFLLRLLRRESVQQAVSGLFAVGIAVALAAATGQARDYFVPGLIRNAVIAVVLLGSVVVRRPLVGVVAEFLAPSHLGAMSAVSLGALRRRTQQTPADPAPVREVAEPEHHWREDSRVLRAYSWLTVLWAGTFLLRVLVQWPLYQADEVELLATASLVLGLPLTAVAAAITLWVVARLHRHRLAPAEDDAATGPAE